MNIADIFVILLLAAAVAAAFRIIHRNKGGCCHDCSRCGGCRKKEKSE